MQGCISVETEHIVAAKAPKDSNTYKNSMHGCGKQVHRFTFSKIFGEKTTQKEFFDDTVLIRVKDFIEGQNCLIFTYGVTNSGKTYTIQGRLLLILFQYYYSSDGGIPCGGLLCSGRIYGEFITCSGLM